MISRSLPLLAALLMSGPSLVLGQALESAAPASRLVALLGEVERMEARVDQLVLDQSGREVQEAQAELVLSKPDHFYWRTIAPYEEVMVTDGHTLWVYEPDLEQLSIQDFSGDLSRTPALLLSEDAETLHASFDISVEASNGREQFTLLPRDPGSLFEILSLNFSQGRLEDMHFEDSLGQKTHMRFNILSVNQPVDETLFRFEAPAGVDIIDNRAE